MGLNGEQRMSEFLKKLENVDGCNIKPILKELYFELKNEKEMDNNITIEYDEYKKLTLRFNKYDEDIIEIYDYESSTFICSIYEKIFPCLFGYKLYNKLTDKINEKSEVIDVTITFKPLNIDIDYDDEFGPITL